ncbi:ATP-binding cassette sub-family A member 17-like [Haemaphysalis longicornis]
MSIAVALLGLPPIVLLDEPYAGVDVVSRSKIIEVLRRIKQKTRSLFVLNSHILDECEISCDRLSIMVDGQLKCHGGVQHLRDKYGNGYRLNFMLRHDASGDAAATAQQFSEAVPSLFPGATLSDQHENVFSYHVVERMPWSQLFAKVESLQEDFALEYAMVGDNTLENIFLAFAKTREKSQMSKEVSDSKIF